MTTTAADVTVNPRVVLGPQKEIYIDDFQLQEVGTGRCIYNEESRTCSFYQGECSINFGGVMCSVSNCQIGADLLSGLNGKFEAQAGAAEFKADKWDFADSWYNNDNRHYREKKLGASDYNLVLKSANNPQALSTKLSNVQVTPGKRYALYFKL